MSGRTKVAYIQPNSEIGGSDICLLRMVQNLDHARFEPIVILPNDGPLVPAFEKAGARVRFVPMLQLRTKLSPSWQFRYITQFPKTVAALSRVIEEEDAAIVHTNSLYCLYGPWAAHRARRKHVWHIREIPPNIPVGRQVLAKMVERLSTRIVPMTVACERGLFDGRALPHSSILYEGISLAEFGSGVTGERVRRDLEIGPSTPLVGFVARLDPWKGLEVFLRAAAIVHQTRPDVHFLVAGGPPKGFEDYAEEMRALAQRLGLGSQVHFTNFRYGAADIPELMSAVTMLAHTSVRPEPFGLVLIEALAMSRPVISTKMGGPLEIMLDGQTGYLIAPGEPEKLAATIDGLLADPVQIEAMGRAARARVEQMFSVESFRRNLSAVYDRVLADAGSC